MQSAPKSRLETFAVIEAVANRLEASPALLRRRWSDEAKARILEAALAPGANVSAVARAHDVIWSKHTDTRGTSQVPR